MPRDIVIGIDPGAYGAIAVLDSDGCLLVLDDMPALTRRVKSVRTKSGDTKKTDIDVPGLMAMITPYAYRAVAYLEQVHAFPKQGVVSAWTLAQFYWTIVGVLAALRIPYTLVTPQRWQSYTMSDMDKVDTKKACLTRSLQLFPQYADRFRTVNGRHKDGITDALLIAWYGQQQAAFGMQPPAPDDDDLVLA